MTTTATSSDELSREISNLSTSSSHSHSDVKSDGTIKNDKNDHGDGYSDDDFSDSDDSDGKPFRQDTSESLKSGKMSRQSTSAMSVSSRPSSSRPTTGMSSVGTSRENTIENNVSEGHNGGEVSRESTRDSKFSSSRTKKRENSAASSTTTSEASITAAAVSRENTNVSLVSNHSDGDRASSRSSALSRGSTMASRGTGLYEDDFEEDHNGSASESSSRQQSFVGKATTDADDNSEDSEEDVKKLEKENSVLIEKDGKFELVDEESLTVDQRNALGLAKRSKQKPNTLLGVPASNGRVRKSSNPEYDHVKSSK